MSRPVPRTYRLSDCYAAMLASRDLGYRVPLTTVRVWRHRGLVTGGRGWVDMRSLAKLLERFRRERADAL